MKNQIYKSAFGLAVALGMWATGFVNAAVFNGTPTGSIPDYQNGIPGEWADQTTSSFGSGYTLTDVTLSLNITGGWNGDLIGYLSYYDGVNTTLINLMNRPGYSGTGFGYGNTGFAITLSDAGAHGIESYQTPSYGATYNGSGQLEGTWNADGSFASFDNMGASGTWTLFFSDNSGGSVSTVQSWSVSLTAVPEPTTWGLIGFEVVFAGTGAGCAGGGTGKPCAGALSHELDHCTARDAGGLAGAGHLHFGGRGGRVCCVLAEPADLKSEAKGLNRVLCMSSPQQFCGPAFSPDADNLLTRSSLYREFMAEREEILRHKWFESEKAGRDIGFESALVSWVVHHCAQWRKARQSGESS